jgi:hypothetical protein
MAEHTTEYHSDRSSTKALMFTRDIQRVERHCRPASGRYCSCGKPNPTDKAANKPTGPPSEDCKRQQEPEDEIDDHYRSIKLPVVGHG